MKVGSRRKSDLLCHVLNSVANAAIAISRHPARHSLSVYRALRDFKELQAMSDRQLRYVSRYVINKKYIAIRRHERGHAHIELTRAGTTVVAGNALYALKPVKQAVWDRKWRIVMFDIPNEMKSARDMFAGTLKRFGFERIQKSVFVYPYPCEEELEVVAEYLGIADHIDIILADRITRENSYKKTFGL